MQYAQSISPWHELHCPYASPVCFVPNLPPDTRPCRSFHTIPQYPLHREVNHAMFVTTFLRSMPEGAKARRGYERLIGSGKVPGEDMSFSAERGSRERVTSWKEAARVMDLGMASVLRVSEVAWCALVPKVVGSHLVEGLRVRSLV